MTRCDTCMAKKVCDHNRLGFENCGNYIPTADVAPKSEVERLQAEVDRLLELVGTIPPDRVEFVSRTEINAIKENLAREIFEEIERCTVQKVINQGKVLYDTTEQFAELKKKYTGETV